MSSQHSERLTCRPRDEQAVTIVELIIALTIIAITFATLLSVVLAVFSGIRNNEARVQATALSNEIIEEMVATPWSQLGLYVDEVPAPTFTVDGNDENVVLLPAEDPRDPLVPLPTEVDVDRDGRLYQVERWITWYEAEGDDDVKRLTVIVTWESGGQTRTMRTEGLRAPLPAERLDLTVEITELGSVANNNLAEIGLNPDFTNAQEIRVLVTVGEVAADVELSWRDRSGALQQRESLGTPGGSVEREVLISAGGSTTFAHGPMSFVVTAVGTDGQVASNTATMNFFQPLDIVRLEVLQGGLETPTITLDCSGEPIAPVSVFAQVDGITGSEAFADGVTLDWSGGLPDFGVTSVSRLPSGGEFTFDLAGQSFTEDPTTFTVTAHRTGTVAHDDGPLPGAVTIDVVAPDPDDPDECP